MNTYALLEPLLVSLIVAACAGAALRRIAPRQLARLSAVCQRMGLPAWIGYLFGKTLTAAADCSSGCSSCSNCGPSPKQNKQIVTLHRNKPVQKNGLNLRT
jgi:hypothetical protein